MRHVLLSSVASALSSSPATSEPRSGFTRGGHFTHAFPSWPRKLGGVALAALALVGAPAAARAGDAALQISELRVDQPGTDNDEYFELLGVPGASLDGYTYLVIGDDTTGGSGVIEEVTSLDGLSINVFDGYFVVAEATFTLGTADATTSLNFENGDHVTHLLVTGFTGSLGQDLDSNDDGVLDLTPWTSIADCVALTDGAAGDQIYCGTVVGPDGGFVPGHVYSCPAGWQIGPFDPAVGLDTPGNPNPCTPATPTISIADAAVLEGDSGTVNLVLTVTVEPAAAVTVSFDIDTADGTATVADGDYDAQSLDGQTITPGGSYQLSVVVHGDTDPELDESFTVTLSNVSGATEGDLVASGTILNDDGVLLTPIHDIQGSGASSPLVALEVTTHGIVTGVKSNGFFLQTPDADVDADPATSEGIVVFTGTAPTVAVGDELQVTGTVSEFSPNADPQQPPLTELGAPLTISTPLSTGNPLPAPVALTSLDPDPAGAFDQLERLEGMRVSVGSLEVVGPTLGSLTETTGATASNGIFYAVVEGVGRPRREAGVQLPDDLAVLLGGPPPPSIPRFDTNPERIRVDSDALGNVLLDLRTGATVAGMVGPLDYAFRTYTLLPDAGAVLVPSGGVAPTAAATPTAGEVTVASYNFERFFDDADDPSIGEPIATPAYYQARLTKASLHIRDYLHYPDVLGAMEIENLGVLQDLAARISADAVANAQPDPQYAAYLVEGNDIGGIDVGFLARTAPVNGATPRVEVLSVTQEGASTTWVDPSDGLPHLLNDRPPLVMEAIVHHANGSELPLTVVVVHQRSLGGITSTGADGLTTQGDRVRRKRRAQAEFLASLIQSRQTLDPLENLIAVGDYNAFEASDGLVDVMGTVMGAPAPAAEVALASADLVDPDLARLADSDDYSYVFDGNAQNLDHALVNAALVAATSARSLDHARINADFANQDAGDPVARMADHDPLLAYLEVATFADPNALFRDDFESETICKWSSATAGPACPP